MVRAARARRMLPGAVIRENLLFLRLVRLPQTRYLC